MEVARATMRRVRRSAEVLSGRLTALGWHALSGTMVSPRANLPLPGQLEAEALTGAPLPVALLAFREQVGGLDFIWDCERSEPCPDLFGGLSVFDLAADRGGKLTSTPRLVYRGGAFYYRMAIGGRQFRHRAKLPLSRLPTPSAP